uniref:Uncharacterized protein n=1 Tax=Globodera rostochiensis TaxID=31243 RepID=A0A914HSW0_GLORO
MDSPIPARAETDAVMIGFARIIQISKSCELVANAARLIKLIPPIIPPPPLLPVSALINNHSNRSFAIAPSPRRHINRSLS